MQYATSYQYKPACWFLYNISCCYYYIVLEIALKHKLPLTQHTSNTTFAAANTTSTYGITSQSNQLSQTMRIMMNASHRPYYNGRLTFFGNNNNDNDNDIGQIKKRRVMKSGVRRVRFNEEVIVRQDQEQEESMEYESSSSSSSLSSSLAASWLSPSDFSNIQNGVFMTLEMMKLQEDRGDCSFGYESYTSYYCSRGLEDYHTKQKGCLKLSTIQRRQNAIDAVLNEQESQRQQRGLYYNYNNNYNSYMMLEDAKISEVYKNQTFYNAENAIDMGGKDSEDALAVYSEEPSQPQLSSSSSTEQEPFIDVTHTTNMMGTTTPYFFFQGNNNTTPNKQQQLTFATQCAVAPTSNEPIPRVRINA